jgi:hypothetical protein
VQAHDLAPPRGAGMRSILATLEQELVDHLVQQGAVIGELLLVPPSDEVPLTRPW